MQFKNNYIISLLHNSSLFKHFFYKSIVLYNHWTFKLDEEYDIDILWVLKYFKKDLI